MKFEDVIVGETYKVVKESFLSVSNDGETRAVRPGDEVKVFGKIDTELTPGYTCCLVEVVEDDEGEWELPFDLIIGAHCLGEL